MNRGISSRNHEAPFRWVSSRFPVASCKRLQPCLPRVCRIPSNCTTVHVQYHVHGDDSRSTTESTGGCGKLLCVLLNSLTDIDNNILTSSGLCIMWRSFCTYGTQYSSMMVLMTDFYICISIFIQHVLVFGLISLNVFDFTQWGIKNWPINFTSKFISIHWPLHHSKCINRGPERVNNTVIYWSKSFRKFL